MPTPYRGCEIESRLTLSRFFSQFAVHSSFVNSARICRCAEPFAETQRSICSDFSAADNNLSDVISRYFKLPRQFRSADTDLC